MSQESMTQVRQWITEQGIDALLVSQPQNRSYLSGWLEDSSGDDAGVLLIDQERQLLLTNALYTEVVQRQTSGWEIVVPPSRAYWTAIAELAQQHGWKTLGFESSALTYADYEYLHTAGDGIFTLHPLDQGYIEQLRQIKQPDELALLRRAIAITDETFSRICAWIQPGVTEKEVSFEISRLMAVLGADSPSFNTIVASGPNGSMPHAVPSERAIQKGELITIDMGARYKGYCADMTRTICLGEPAEPRMREVYEAVLHAMKVCEAGLRPGMSGLEADALARNALQEVGLAQYYVHSTGHGVGLEIHEGPSLSPRASAEQILRPGMVVTVEPGAYIPGWSGTRVEDCVLIKEESVEVLTHSSTELVLQR